MPHLLVTNDFPPKTGGIQTYLHELWRRLPPGDVTVLTTAHAGAKAWDAAQAFEVVRVRSPFLAPTPRLARRIDELARRVGAAVVVLDPAWPLGALGPRLERPFGLILHGAEVSVPARLPGVQLWLRRSLREASLVIAAGEYPAAEGRFSAGRPVDATVIPPGVDPDRFRPLAGDERRAARRRLGVADGAVLIVGVSRLVARKGFDVLIEASAGLAGDAGDTPVEVLIAGAGRDHARLEALIARTGAPARLLGRVDDDALPALYGAAEVFAMVCRDRWAGLEQEGFGIVFLEAAAAGVPAVAGASGGSAEAVVHGETGLVVDDPRSVDEVRAALGRLVADGSLRRRMGAAARERVSTQLSYDALARRLGEALAAVETRLAPAPGPAGGSGPGDAAVVGPVSPDAATGAPGHQALFDWGPTGARVAPRQHRASGAGR